MNALNSTLFYFFAALAIVSALLMVSRRNIVHAAIFLAIALLATAGIFLQLQAEFLFIVQIFLFVGGITAVFVFAIMLARPGVPSQPPRFTRQRIVATVLASVLASELFFAIVRGRGSLLLAPRSAGISSANTEAVGDALFRQFIVPFEIASILLLVATIGAVVLSGRNRDAFD